MPKILDEEGQWREGREEVAKAAIDYFQRTFNIDSKSGNLTCIEYIQARESDEDNAMLMTKPTKEETKVSEIDIDPTSAAGPDGLNALFYQKCWPIIADNVHNAVTAFFSGANIPRFFLHTCLVRCQRLSSLNSYLACGLLAYVMFLVRFSPRSFIVHQLWSCLRSFL